MGAPLGYARNAAARMRATLACRVKRRQQTAPPTRSGSEFVKQLSHRWPAGTTAAAAVQSATLRYGCAMVALLCPEYAYRQARHAVVGWRHYDGLTGARRLYTAGHRR